MESSGFLVSPREGDQMWVVDELIRFVARGHETGGAYTLTESYVLPDGGPPTHKHRREDEAFWVLEGNLQVTVGHHTSVVPAGGFIHLPRGVPHRFHNDSQFPVRFLTLLVPAGLEGFFESVGVPGSMGDAPPGETPEHIARIHELAPRYGIELMFDDAPGE